MSEGDGNTHCIFSRLKPRVSPCMFTNNWGSCLRQPWLFLVAFPRACLLHSHQDPGAFGCHEPIRAIKLLASWAAGGCQGQQACAHQHWAAPPLSTITSPPKCQRRPERCQERYSWRLDVRGGWCLSHCAPQKGAACKPPVGNDPWASDTLLAHP